MKIFRKDRLTVMSLFVPLLLTVGSVDARAPFAGPIKFTSYGMPFNSKPTPAQLADAGRRFTSCYNVQKISAATRTENGYQVYRYVCVYPGGTYKVNRIYFYLKNGMLKRVREIIAPPDIESCEVGGWALRGFSVQSTIDLFRKSGWTLENTRIQEQRAQSGYISHFPYIYMRKEDAYLIMSQGKLYEQKPRSEFCRISFDIREWVRYYLPLAEKDSPYPAMLDF